MSLTVTLNVFSGRPNPVWTLPEEAGTEIRERIARITTTSNLKASGSGGLGYRGFTVVGADHGLAATHVFAGLVDQGHTIPTLMGQDRELERWLLSTAGEHVANAVRAHVEGMLSVPAAAAAAILAQAAMACPPCHAADAPAYNPGLWNTPSVQPNNNCYNYANNRITNTFAQPGRATGHPVTVLSCQGVVPSAQSDRLVTAPSFGGTLAAGQGWYAALVIWPGQDYHWYRQDSVGCWSHKPGQTAVRNVDNGGQPISDPKIANRGPYTDFCTYVVTKTTVQIS